MAAPQEEGLGGTQQRELSSENPGSGVWGGSPSSWKRGHKVGGRAGRFWPLDPGDRDKGDIRPSFLVAGGLRGLGVRQSQEQASWQQVLPAHPLSLGRVAGRAQPGPEGSLGRPR